MKKYTKRVVAILKQSLADMDSQAIIGVPAMPDLTKVVAYTPRIDIDDLLRKDVEMMIAELECECTHECGPYTNCFAPETICPDQLMKFNKHSIELVCNNTCVNHLRHGQPIDTVGVPMTINTLPPNKEKSNEKD